MKPRNLRQTSLFSMALQEKGIVVDYDQMEIDHENHNCYYKDRKYPLIYPKAWVKRIEELDHTKTLEYFFAGCGTKGSTETYSPRREWVKDFISQNSIIEFSIKGRTIPKDLLDEEWFGKMCKARFGLCPKGYPYSWTYRFYEAMLCRAIPIVEEVEPYMAGFKVYLKSERHTYDEAMCDHNYKLFLERHTLGD